MDTEVHDQNRRLLIDEKKLYIIVVTKRPSLFESAQQTKNIQRFYRSPPQNFFLIFFFTKKCNHLPQKQLTDHMKLFFFCKNKTVRED